MRARLEAAGLTLLYLPRYSPDLSPIELLWAKLKAYLRAVAARTAEALDTALADALNRITPTDARGFCRHCGYVLSAN
ncbi:MAG: transposase [Betaproteobacteria bacterium]